VEKAGNLTRPGRKNQEILVVGGSAAGMYAAARLAHGGKSVRVLESRPTLEANARTLIVTDHFKSQISSAAKSCILNEINRFELFTNGRSAQFSLRRPDLIIERARLIRSLSQEAGQAGAQLDYDTRFLGLGPNNTGIRIEVEQRGQRDELHAQSVIGADGATSRVARAAGWPAVETVPLVQAVIKLPKDCPQDTTRVWFIPDDTPYFYWLIPESAERAAVGVIGEQGQATKIAFDRFLQKKGFEPLEWQGARIPVYKKWIPVQRSVGNGEVYLVGDAAAQVKVSTVGGIVTGLRGAHGVADAILRNGKSELRALRRELSTHWLIRRALHFFQQDDYSRLVDMLNDSTRESLGEINRDESTKLLWNVIRSQPRLMLIGLRGLLLGRK
jgi:digeranylgeranylglycerophospholipid reductase